MKSLNDLFYQNKIDYKKLCLFRVSTPPTLRNRKEDGAPFTIANIQVHHSSHCDPDSYPTTLFAWGVHLDLELYAFYIIACQYHNLKGNTIQLVPHTAEVTDLKFITKTIKDIPEHLRRPKKKRSQ